MILGVVPTNLIDPFLKNNTAQLVILGLLIGAGVLVLGDSVPELKWMIEQINKLVMSVMQIVLLTMPAIPFPSILIALGSGKGKGLLSGWKYVVASYAIFTICILIKGGLVMRKENCLLPILMSVLLTIFAGGGFAIAQEAQETELTLEDYAEDRVPSDTAEKEYTLDRVVALSRHNIRSPLSGSGSLLGDITPHTWFEWTSNPSELSIRGALLETQMGQYFRLWLENEGLFPENYRPNEGEVRFYANAKQRTRATAHYFSAGLLPVGNVTIEMHGDYDTMDSVFNPAVTFYNDDYRKAVEEQIAEKGGIADMNGIHAGLRDAIDLLMDVVDMEQSEAYKAGNFGDLQNPGLTMILKAGDEPDVSGFLKTANSVADALTFQFYEMADEKAAAFGHDLTIEDWRKIHTIVDAYTEIRFGMPLLAVNIAHPLLLEIRDELQAEGRKFSFLCGHDANISSVLSALGVSDYLLPETVEQKTPIGSKLLFSRWLDKNGEPYWSVELVYQNTDQLRNMTPLSLAAPPVRYALDFEGVSKNADGMIAESDFMALFDNAVSAYDALADQYGAEVIDEAA